MLSWQYTDNPKVLIAGASADCSQKRHTLSFVLERAGLKPIPVAEQPRQEDEKFYSDLKEADCSVHILGTTYDPVLTGSADLSIAEYHFREARKKLFSNSDFRMFVWHPADTGGANVDSRQFLFIREVMNSVTGNIFYTNAETPIQLVEDIRSITRTNGKKKFDTKQADVFFIYNEKDDEQSLEIADMLSDIAAVEKLCIIQDSGFDYYEFCFQQMRMSKMAVVFFRHSADWALPFAKQIWKKAGGASSGTPLLLIGDESADVGRDITLQAPKLILLTAPGELVPLEIKVHLDRITEQQNN